MLVLEICVQVMNSDTEATGSRNMVSGSSDGSGAVAAVPLWYRNARFTSGIFVPVSGVEISGCLPYALAYIYATSGLITWRLSIEPF